MRNLRSQEPLRAGDIQHKLGGACARPPRRMTSFIGAALPWVGGKVSDLLGLASKEEQEPGATNNSQRERESAAVRVPGRRGTSILPALAATSVSSERFKTPGARRGSAAHAPGDASRSIGRDAEMATGDDPALTTATTSGGNRNAVKAPVRRVRNRTQGVASARTTLPARLSESSCGGGPDSSKRGHLDTNRRRKEAASVRVVPTPENARGRKVDGRNPPSCIGALLRGNVSTRPAVSSCVASGARRAGDAAGGKKRRAADALSFSEVEDAECIVYAEGNRGKQRRKKPGKRIARERCPGVDGTNVAIGPRTDATLLAHAGNRSTEEVPSRGRTKDGEGPCKKNGVEDMKGYDCPARLTQLRAEEAGHRVRRERLQSTAPAQVTLSRSSAKFDDSGPKMGDVDSSPIAGNGSGSVLQTLREKNVDRAPSDVGILHSRGTTPPCTSTGNGDSSSRSTVSVRGLQGKVCIGRNDNQDNSKSSSPPSTPHAEEHVPRSDGRLAWCGDIRLLQRPSATLQLRRHSTQATEMAQSTEAAYLGRLDLTPVSEAQVSLATCGTTHAQRGEHGITNSPAGGRGAGTGCRETTADDAITLSSCVSGTSGEDSDSDIAFMMANDRDDPTSGSDDVGVEDKCEASHKERRLEGRTGHEKASKAAERNKSAEASTGNSTDEDSSYVRPEGLFTNSTCTQEHPRSRGQVCATKRKTNKVVAGVGNSAGMRHEASSVDSDSEPLARSSRSRSVAAQMEPLVPPPPPNVVRKWPARPPHRALVYAAAAEASRRARGFSGWSFPALPPPPPPPSPLPPSPPRVATAPRQAPKVEEKQLEEAGKTTESSGEAESKCKGRVVKVDYNTFLGYARENPPGKASPNEFGWMALDPMHTPEGRAAAKRKAVEEKRRAMEIAARRKRQELEKRRQDLEKIALQKRQEILDALRIKEEIAEARRKRKLSILFLGMTRVAEYDSRGGLAKGLKRFDLVEKMVRDDVDETNMNPLRDTARVLAMEALGHEVRCISKVSTPGESDCDKFRSTRAKGGPTGLGRFLATDMTTTGGVRGFLRRIEEKWENITFDTVLLDHYWLPDSVVWLNKGYMANDGGLIQNLVKMTTTDLLSNDFEIMLPINQAFFELLLPHFRDLEKHFTVEFLVGERLEHLKKSHLALEADDLIPADVMLNVYGKEREHQVSQMLGVKQPTTEVAAILLKYGVSAQHFCYARFLKLSRNPPPHPALAAVALTAASESAKIAEESARIAAETAKIAAETAKMAAEAACLAAQMAKEDPVTRKEEGLLTSQTPDAERESTASPPEPTTSL